MFEPRYRAMTEDALSGDRLIGMTLLKSGTSAPEAGPAPVFEVGCAGRITSHRESSDGTHDLLLEGRRRFRVLEQETVERGYILARVEHLDDPSFDELDDALRTGLAATRGELEPRMLEYARLKLHRNLDRLRDRMRELDPVALVHAVSFGIDCGMVEKQGLLEAPDPLERARLLIRLLDFQLAAERLPDASDRLN
jgi:Lon protease-like protein